MRTLGKLFIIITALLALAVAFAWKHFTKPAPAVQASAATTESSASTTSAQPRSPTANTRSASASASSSAADRAQAFQSLKQRAKDGDAVAQRLLAQTYDACFMINLDRQRFVAGYQHMRMNKPEQAAVLDRLAQQRMELCDVVDGGAIVPTELVKGWYAQAAANGHLPGRAMDNALNLREYNAATATKLLEEVVASGDPAAVYTLGGTLGGSMVEKMSEPYATLVRGPLASSAWMVAGCRMGYDCGPESSDVVNMCLLSGRCLGESYEEMVFATLQSDAERQALEQKIQQILEAVGP